MLQSGTGSIKEICIDAGYADPNYFSRIFNKILGCTPTEYRDGTGIMEASAYQQE
jgi:two-component system response regulator YesN